MHARQQALLLIRGIADAFAEYVSFGASNALELLHEIINRSTCKRTLFQRPAGLFEAPGQALLDSRHVNRSSVSRQRIGNRTKGQAIRGLPFVPGKYSLCGPRAFSISNAQLVIEIGICQGEIDYSEGAKRELFKQGP